MLHHERALLFYMPAQSESIICRAEYKKQLVCISFYVLCTLHGSFIPLHVHRVKLLIALLMQLYRLNCNMEIMKSWSKDIIIIHNKKQLTPLGKHLMRKIMSEKRRNNNYDVYV